MAITALGLRSPGCLTRLRSLLPTLSPSEHRAAGFLLENYEEAFRASIVDVADRARVSEATITRLAKELGYQGYRDLKLDLAQEALFSPRTLVVQRNGSTDEMIGRVFASSIQGLEETLSGLIRTEVDRAVTALQHARRVEFFGVGNSAWIAADARHKFMKLGLVCGADPDAQGQMMAASLLGRWDVAIAISHSGRTRPTVRALSLAKAAGATTVCITNYAAPPLVRVADIKLMTASHDTSFYSEAMGSRLCQLAIVDCLYIGLIQRSRRKFLTKQSRAHAAVADEQLRSSMATTVRA